MHLCMGAYGEHSSRLRNFEGFKLVTNQKETKDAKCKIDIHVYFTWISVEEVYSHASNANA